MLLGSGRLTGLCWRSAYRQANFYHLEQTVILSPQRQLSIQCNSSSSFSNLAKLPSSSANDASTTFTGSSPFPSSILSEVEIRKKSGLHTNSNSPKKLSDYTDLFVAHFAVLREALQSQSKTLRLKAFFYAFSPSKSRSKEQQRVLHLSNSSHTEGQRPNPSAQPGTPPEVPSEFIFWFILGLNVIIFGVWQLAISQADKGDPTLLVTMYKNFTSSLYNVFQGRWWTLLTPCLSHMSFGHIILNMLTYFYFGRMVLKLVGGRSFFLFYLTAGIASSGFSLFLEYLGYTNKQKEGQQKMPKSSLGASGSIIAIVTCFSSIKPRATFLLYFILPIQARILIPALFLYDLWGVLGTEPNKAWWDKNTVIDSAGHIGGFIAGRLYWIFKLKRFRVMW